MLGLAVRMLRTRTLAQHLARFPPQAACLSSTTTSGQKDQPINIKAVIFDLGGVLAPGPGRLFRGMFSLKLEMDEVKKCLRIFMNLSKSL